MKDRHVQDAEEGRSIAFECELPEPPSKVWRALTTPEIVSEWLFPTDLRAEQGAGFVLRDGAAADPIECEVLAVEEGRLIRFGWRDSEARARGLDSTVTFQIAAAGSGTHLRIVHEVRRLQSASRPAAFGASNDNSRLRLAA